MAEHIPCVYCLEIPPLDKDRSGTVRRCPLCRTEILETAGDASYRLRTDDGEEIHPPKSRFNRLLAFFGVGSSVLVFFAVYLGWQGLRQREEGLPPAPDSPALIQLAAILEMEPVETTPPAQPVFVKAAVKAMASEPGAVAKPAPSTATPPPEPVAQADPRSQLPTNSQVELFLAQAPELALVNFGKSEAEAKQSLTNLAQRMLKENNAAADGFIHQLKKDRPDLAGLPFVLSPDCQLSEKDGQFLQASALAARTLLDRGRSSLSSRNRPAPGFEQASPLFWSTWNSKGAEAVRVAWELSREQEGVRSASVSSRERLRRELPKGFDFSTHTLSALVQIISGEDTASRFGLVGHLRDISGPAATKALVKRALYDLDWEVRYAAIEALKKRPKGEYANDLLDGFHYPWSVVAYRAAEAALALKCDDLVPKLVNLLEAPDPTAPFVKDVDGRSVWTVRQIVKVNHHRSCLLCHPSSDKRTDLVRGAAPNPYRPLPPSIDIYCPDVNIERTAGAVVRADITYLRQDFSARLPVENSGAWPKLLRFDFLVRERPLTDAEYAAWQARTCQEESDHRQAILYALRRLTNRELGPSTAAWQRAYRSTSVPTWRSACLK
ncbi:MAG: HEAT repeat domain-containing protein [Gemmataceae bacterium]|nr:HEAT repeat domain-containing protein [Gemmataceae bacterium]